MTATLLAVIGIVIAALCTAAGFVYYDIDSGSALEGGIAVSQSVLALDEAAAAFLETTGARPTSIDDLKSISDLPMLPKFPGAAWTIGPEHVCVLADRGEVADRSLRNAARRLGSKATVSGRCGAPDAPTTAGIVLSYPMSS